VILLDGVVGGVVDDVGGDEVDGAFVVVGGVEFDVVDEIGNVSIIVCILEICNFISCWFCCTVVGDFNFCSFGISALSGDGLDFIEIIVLVMYSLCWSRRIVGISFCVKDIGVFDDMHFAISRIQGSQSLLFVCEGV